MAYIDIKHLENPKKDPNQAFKMLSQFDIVCKDIIDFSVSENKEMLGLISKN